MAWLALSLLLPCVAARLFYVSDTLALDSSKRFGVSQLQAPGDALHVFLVLDASNATAVNNASRIAFLQVRAWLVFDGAPSLPFASVSFSVAAHGDALAGYSAWTSNNSVAGTLRAASAASMSADPTDSRFALLVGGAQSATVSIDVPHSALRSDVASITPWLLVSARRVLSDSDDPLTTLPNDAVTTLRAGDALPNGVFSTAVHHEVCTLPYTLDAANGTRRADATLAARSWLAITPLLPAANRTSQQSLASQRVSEGGSTGRVAPSCGDGVTLFANDFSVAVVDSPTSTLVVDGETATILGQAMSFGFWPQSDVPFAASDVFVDVRTVTSADRPRVAQRTTLRQGDDLLVFDPASANEWLTGAQIYAVCSSDAEALLQRNAFLLNSACFLVSQPALLLADVTVDVPAAHIVRIAGFYRVCNFSSWLPQGRGTVWTAVWPNRGGGVALPTHLTAPAEDSAALVQFPSTTQPSSTTAAPPTATSAAPATAPSCEPHAPVASSLNPADPVVIGVSAVALLCFSGTAFFLGFVCATRRQLRSYTRLRMSTEGE